MKWFDYDSLRFAVNDGMILTMENMDYETPKSVTLPVITPDGENINSLGTSFCIGKFKEIIVPDEIRTAAAGAFSYTLVDNVIWSKNCKVIPDRCFYGSYISSISNIQDVVEISTAAFASSKIQEVVWPNNCFTIPARCFYGSCISKVGNIDRVSSILFDAFEGSHIKSIEWPSACCTVPKLCFANSRLKEISNVSSITDIEYGAFANSKVKYLDLSSLLSLRIGVKAFSGLSPQNIILPYYFTDDDNLDLFYRS